MKRNLIILLIIAIVLSVTMLTIHLLWLHCPAFSRMVIWLFTAGSGPRGTPPIVPICFMTFLIGRYVIYPLYMIRLM